MRFRSELPRAAAFIVCLVALGCAPSLDGERHASGSFSDLQVFEAEGAVWAAALGGVGRHDELTLLSLSDGRHCTVAPVSRFFPRTAPDDSLAIATWAEGEDGGGTLSFVDAGCRSMMDPIDGAKAPHEVLQGILGGAWHRHLFVGSEDGPLRLVDPWSGGVVQLAAAVRAWRWAQGSSLWILDGGVLSLADVDAGTRREVGADVAEVSFLPGGGLAYADGAGVSLVRAPDAEPELVATDACEPQTLRDGRRIALLSPCAEGRLVVFDLDSGVLTPVAGNVTAFRAETSPLFFTRGPSNDGELFALVDGSEMRVASHASLASVRQVTEDGMRAHLLHAGGDLLRFDGSTTSTLLRGVKAFGVRHDHIAAVVEADDGAGTLVLQRELLGAGPEVLGRGVPSHRFAFADQLEALGFVSGHDGTRGKLELVSLTTDDRLVVDDEVSEFAEMRSEILPGIAYLVPYGPRAGIWFATPE